MDRGNDKRGMLMSGIYSFGTCYELDTDVRIYTAEISGDLIINVSFTTNPAPKIPMPEINLG